MDDNSIYTLNEALMFDRHLIQEIYGIHEVIKAGISRYNQKVDYESILFQKWLKSLPGCLKQTTQKGRMGDVEYVNHDYPETEDKIIYYLQFADVSEYNGEKTIGLFSVFAPFLSDIRPDYLLTVDKVYKIVETRKNSWFNIKTEIKYEEYLSIDDIDLNNYSHRKMFWYFLMRYSKVKNESLILNDIDKYKLENRLDNIERFASEFELNNLRTILKIDAEIKGQVNDLQRFMNSMNTLLIYNEPTWGFDHLLPMKPYVFIPGKGWGFNDKFDNLVKTLQLKLFFVIYTLLNRNLHLYYLLSKNSFKAEEHYVALERFGILDSHFEKKTLDYLEKQNMLLTQISSSLREISNNIVQLLKDVNKINENLLINNINSEKMKNMMEFNNIVNTYQTFQLYTIKNRIKN